MSARIVHLAGAVTPSGDVSAVCFKKPRPIDMKQATWTTSTDLVTCERCLAKLASIGAALFASSASPRK